MECAVDPRDILSHFHVHKARFWNRAFGISLQKDLRTCSKEPLEGGHKVGGSFLEVPYKVHTLGSISWGTYDLTHRASLCMAFGTRILYALGLLDDTSCDTRDRTRVAWHMV